MDVFAAQHNWAEVGTRSILVADRFGPSCVVKQEMGPC
jgi:hypothetical protein